MVLYGKETRKAQENFALGEEHTNLQLIYAMLDIKKAAAMTYKELGMMENWKADAVMEACKVLKQEEYRENFMLHPLQGGAGTSTNMNVCETVAGCALEILGKDPEDYMLIHPLDDVNRGQSTNDVYPTALRIAAIRLVRELSEEASRLQESLQKKELEYGSIQKLGRTELMDALPITVGEEFGAYAQAIGRDRWRIYKVEERLRQVNLGGTAIGLGDNADRRYRYLVVEHLREMTGIGLALAEYPVDLTQNNDVFVETSGLLKALAVNLMKIAGDLRWMNSGPKGGLGEIILEEVQAGSTIMPGKVNPVIPEMVTQAAMKVMANDQAITYAAANGNFELNAFLPLIADSLLGSLELLIKTCKIFRERCIDTLRVNEEGCRKHLEGSLADVTHMSVEIGYDRAAKMAGHSADILASHPSDMV